MDYRYLFVIFFIVAILVHVVYLAVSYFIYQRNNSKVYNFFNNFMFELNNFRRYQKQSWISLSVLVLIGLLYISPSIFFLLNGKGSLVYQIMFIVMSTISVTSLLALFFIKLSNYKLHLAFDVVFAMSNLIFGVLSIIFLGSGESFGFIYNESSTKILIIVFGVIFAVLQAIIMLNPTYKTWDKMVKVDATYSRPKYCYLSILEWGSFIIFVLNFILPCIALFA